MEQKLESVIGKKFGRWTILGFACVKEGNPYYKSQCECGCIKDIRLEAILRKRIRKCVVCDE